MGSCCGKSQTADEGKPSGGNQTSKNAMKPAAAGATAKQPAAAPAASSEKLKSPSADEQQARLAERDRMEAKRRAQEVEALKAKGGFISYQDGTSGAGNGNGDRPAVELHVAKPPTPDPAVAAAAAKAGGTQPPPAAVVEPLHQKDEPVLTGRQGRPAADKDDEFSDPENDGPVPVVPATAKPTPSSPPPPPEPSPPMAAPESAPAAERQDSDDDSDANGAAEAEESPAEAKDVDADAEPNPVVDVTPEKTINVSEGRDDDLRGPSTARVEEVPLHLAKPGHGAYGHDLDNEGEMGRPDSPNRETKAFRRGTPPPPPPPPPLHEEANDSSTGSPVEEPSNVNLDDDDDMEASTKEVVQSEVQEADLVPHDPAEDEAADKSKEEDDVVVHPDGTTSAVHKTVEEVPVGGGYTMQTERLDIEDRDAQGHPVGTRHVENTVMAASRDDKGERGDAAASEPHLHPVAVEESTSPLADILKKELDAKQQVDEAAPVVEEPATGVESEDTADDGEAAAEGDADVEDVEMNVELTQTSDIVEEDHDGAANPPPQQQGDISLTSTNSRMTEEEDDAPRPVQVQQAVSQELHQGGFDHASEDGSEDAAAFAPMPKVMKSAAVVPESADANGSAAAGDAGPSDALDDLLGDGGHKASRSHVGGIPPPLPSPAAHEQSAEEASPTSSSAAVAAADPLDDLFGAAPAPHDSSRVLDAELDAAAEEAREREGLETPPPRRPPPPPIMSPPPADGDEDEDEHFEVHDGSIQT